MPSPKDRFIQSEYAKPWADLSANKAFIAAADFAMLQHVENMTPNTNEQLTAYANHYRLEGAKQFLRILENLSIKPEVVAKQAVGQLDHRA